MVWNKAMNLVVSVYSLIGKLPDYEKFGLSDQIRRCVVSIPSNIAEGHGRKNIKEFIHFLCISYGSANELETQLIICEKLGYIDNKSITDVLFDLDEVQKMIHSLVRYLESK